MPPDAAHLSSGITLDYIARQLLVGGILAVALIIIEVVWRVRGTSPKRLPPLTIGGAVAVGVLSSAGLIGARLFEQWEATPETKAVAKVALAAAALAGLYAFRRWRRHASRAARAHAAPLLAADLDAVGDDLPTTCVAAAHGTTKAAALLVGALGLAFGTAAVLMGTRLESRPWLLIWELVGVSTAPLLGSLIVLRTTRHQRPMLVLDPSGVQHSLHGLIEWKQIEGVWVQSHRGLTTVCVELRDEEAWWARRPPVKRLYRWFYLLTGAHGLPLFAASPAKPGLARSLNPAVYFNDWRHVVD